MTLQEQIEANLIKLVESEPYQTLVSQINQALKEKKKKEAQQNREHFSGPYRGVNTHPDYEEIE